MNTQRLFSFHHNKYRYTYTNIRNIYIHTYYINKLQFLTETAKAFLVCHRPRPSPFASPTAPTLCITKFKSFITEAATVYFTSTRTEEEHETYNFKRKKILLK